MNKNLFLIIFILCCAFLLIGLLGQNQPVKTKEPSPSFKQDILDLMNVPLVYNPNANTNNTNNTIEDLANQLNETTISNNTYTYNNTDNYNSNINEGLNYNSSIDSGGVDYNNTNNAHNTTLNDTLNYSYEYLFNISLNDKILNKKDYNKLLDKVVHINQQNNVNLFYICEYGVYINPNVDLNNTNVVNSIRNFITTYQLILTDRCNYV